MTDSNADTGIKELLEAGVHFGHQTRRWDPSMRRYIHGERDGIHIIDLLQTEELLAKARDFCADVAGRGGKILFVGTKKQARDTIEEWADKTGMPYVSRRWLGGLLTNFETISKRIKRLHELTELETERPARAAADEGADGPRGRAPQARVQPRRRSRHAAPAGRDLRDRPERRGDRRQRGDQARNPDRRARRHQLQPAPGRVRDPRQRRRDPLLRADRRHARRGDPDLRHRLPGRPRRPAASARRRNARSARRSSARSARRKRRARLPRPPPRPRRPQGRGAEQPQRPPRQEARRRSAKPPPAEDR